MLVSELVRCWPVRKMRVRATAKTGWCSPVVGMECLQILRLMYLNDRRHHHQLRRKLLMAERRKP